ncbi:MAG: LPS export ABC transporter periplasmic protein LptC [Alphaproteobacteria bacterium]
MIAPQPTAEGLPPVPSRLAGRQTSERPDGASTRLYSRFVTWMKILLPGVALLLIVLVVAWPHMKLQDTRFRIGFSALKAGDDEDPSMINPRFLGTDKERQTFSVTADIAKNLLNNKKSVELEMPKADIALDDGTWLVLTAETGIFTRAEETLELRGSVNMFHDSGYEFRTERADVDLTNGTATGDVPVIGQGPFGVLSAEGFRLIDKGKTIYFTGQSKLVMYPGAGKP